MFMHPVPGPITSPYGPRRIGFHNGQDYGWLKADPDNSKRIYAPATGTVTVGRNVLVGNFVLIDTDTATIRLAHLASIAVKSGQTVTQGQTFIGVMGATGSQTFGVHLHVDVYKKSQRVNPAPYFTIPFGTTVAPVEEEDDMKPIVFKRTTSGAEWSLIAPWLEGPSELERGYLVTADATVGLAWERMYAQGSGTGNNVDRAGYVAAQEQARILRAAWVADKTTTTSVTWPSGFTGQFTR